MQIENAIFNISVITISYNNIAGLQKTHKSLLRVIDGVEWIVVDGGSVDGTVKWLSGLDSCNYVSEADKGIYDAMQKGLARASGNFVVFLNAGDCLAGEIDLPKVSQELDVDVAFFDTLLVCEGLEKVRSARSLRSARYSVPAVQQSTIYRRATLEQLDWPVGLKIVGDFFIAAQLFARGASSIVVHKVLSTFEIGGVSTVRPILLCNEAMRVQRGVLGLPFWMLVTHYIRRFLTCLAVRVVYEISPKKNE